VLQVVSNSTISDRQGPSVSRRAGRLLTRKVTVDFDPVEAHIVRETPLSVPSHAIWAPSGPMRRLRSRGNAGWCFMNARSSTRRRPGDRGRPSQLVRAGKKRRREFQTEGLGGFEIDDQLEFGRLLYWKVGRSGAVENCAHVDSHLAIALAVLDP
jgi:hypothetical protein